MPAVGTASPRSLVERFYDEVWNRGDEAAARAILDPAFRFRGSLGVTADDVDGFLAYVRAVRAALGEYRCIIEDMIESGDRVAARMTFTGVHRGELMGVAATGRTVSWSGAAFFTCHDGRIAALWVLGDLDGLRRQLAGPYRLGSIPLQQAHLGGVADQRLEGFHVAARVVVRVDDLRLESPSPPAPPARWSSCRAGSSAGRRRRCPPAPSSPASLRYRRRCRRFLPPSVST